MSYGEIPFGIFKGLETFKLELKIMPVPPPILLDGRGMI